MIWDSAADFQEPVVMVQFGREPQRIDILTYASGLQFSDAYKNRVLVKIGNFDVPFISVDDLRTNKMATNVKSWNAICWSGKIFKIIAILGPSTCALIDFEIIQRDDGDRGSVNHLFIGS